ncbi:RNA polymerase sigma factor [Carboxylicivirga litoralis]|uniref:RNA polymerase sigma factor n=1 Tax=Carboxylicivirga litoralis TaxID=2816963 RepID=UPI0021CAFF53|nr:sigma-70 family RNA polymerase sigma factor [Carboxylicivirga sp. A043]
MNNLNDIIKGCQKGKASAQKQLYQLFAPKMFAVCLRYSKDKTEAEDCLQEGFIKVFNSIDKFGFKGSFEGWVRRIMVNTVIEVYRKKQPELLVDDFPLLADDDANEEYDVAFTQDELMAMIKELPPKYKLVFNMYVIEGYSHAEIAETTGISLGTSKSNLARARQWLKKNIEDRIIEKKQAVC